MLLLGAVATGRGPEADVPATGDYAALELYTRLAAQGKQLLGPYSRFGFHHPGPAYFYACVPLYLLTGGRFAGILLTAGLLNAACIVLVLWRVGRDGGTAALLASALVLARFISWRSPSWLFSAWNPNVAVLPFGVALVSFAAVGAGGTGALPLAALAASFAAQTHLGCLPASLAVAGAAGLLLVPRVRALAGLPPRPRLARGGLVVTALVLAVLWAPPVLEQLSPEGGNLAHIVGFSTYFGESHPAREALPAAGAAIVGWVVAAGPSASMAGLALVVVALAVAHAGARLGRAPFPAALSLVTFAGVGAAILSAARVTGPLLPYLLRWMAVLAVGTAAALAAGTAPLLRPALARRPRLAGTVALIALALMTGRNLALAQAALQAPAPVAEDSQSAARLAAAISPAVRAASRRPLVEVTAHTDRDLVLGVLLALDKSGTPFAVRPFGPFRLGGRFAPDGAEDARLVLGPEDPHLAAEPGVRLLGREAGLFAYLVPRDAVTARP